MQTLVEVKGYGATDSAWRNMLIQGDNLKVLKSFLENPEVKGKVRLIYIDPPFATGREWKMGENGEVKQFSKNGESAYKDTLLDEDYLKFLRERLMLLKELLAEDGSIYVHIDYKIGHYVKIMMDEVFGKKNFINDITRLKCNPKNFSRRAYGNIKDMVLFYSKGQNYVWNDSREKFTDNDIERLFPKKDKNGRRYTTYPLHAPGETENGKTGKEWNGMKPPNGRHWRCSPEELTELDEKGLIEWSSAGNPRKIVYADEKIKQGKKRQDIWEFRDPAYPQFPTQKNLELLETIIETSSNKGDLVLDCFSGSGTTLIAAEKHGRRWIGIDKSKAAVEVALKRLEKETQNAFTYYQSIENLQ